MPTRSLIAFIHESAKEFRKQKARRIYPPENPYAACRRAYTLSIFDAVLLEATEFPELAQFRNEFDRLLLPLLELEVMPPPECKISCLQVTRY